MAVNRGPVKGRGWSFFFSRFRWAVAIRMWAAQGDRGGAHLWLEMMIGGAIETFQETENRSWSADRVGNGNCFVGRRTLFYASAVNCHLSPYHFSL